MSWAHGHPHTIVISMTTPCPWISRKRHWIPLALLAAGVSFAVVATLSPWPAALLIRALFEQSAAKTVAEMQPYVPASGLDAQLDVAYADGGADTTFDVFSPSGSTEPLPRSSGFTAVPGSPAAVATLTPTCRSSHRRATRPWP